MGLVDDKPRTEFEKRAAAFLEKYITFGWYQLAREFAAIAGEERERAARIAEAVEGAYAARTASDNHGKWTVGSSAAREIASSIRGKTETK